MIYLKKQLVSLIFLRGMFFAFKAITMNHQANI